MSGAGTVGAGAHIVTIGDPSATAPLTGDTPYNQNMQIAMNPALVAGSPPCSAEDAEGFGIEGTWINPGAFVNGGFATQPPNTKAIAEILFKLSYITYAAYIIERKVLTLGDPIGATHYDIASASCVVQPTDASSNRQGDVEWGRPLGPPHSFVCHRWTVFPDSRGSAPYSSGP